MLKQHLTTTLTLVNLVFKNCHSHMKHFHMGKRNEKITPTTPSTVDILGESHILV